MAYVEFRAPNFRARVSRADNPRKRWWHYMFGTSAEAARAELESTGLVVLRVEAYDFKEYHREKIAREIECYRGGGRCDACERQGRAKHSFSELWGDLKEYLKVLFYNKCAYCESRFAHVAFGDVEHFRPKAKVEEEADHPGYYWLAYEPSNYVPSCQLCNQGGGKANHFPIGGQRAFTEADALAEEAPLLLNPDEDDYWAHIGFFPSEHAEVPGHAFGHDPKGEETVDLLKLNREALVEDRRTEQDNARLRFKYLVNEKPQEIETWALAYLRGDKPYATAVIAEINAYCAHHGWVVSPFRDLKPSD